MEIKRYKLDEKERSRFQRALDSIANRILARRTPNPIGVPEMEEMREIARNNLPARVVDGVEQEVVQGNSGIVAIDNAVSAEVFNQKSRNVRNNNIPLFALNSMVGTTLRDHLDLARIANLEMDILFSVANSVTNVFSGKSLLSRKIREIARLTAQVVLENSKPKFHGDFYALHMSLTAMNCPREGEDTLFASVEEIYSYLPPDNKFVKYLTPDNKRIAFSDDNIRSKNLPNEDVCLSGEIGRASEYAVEKGLNPAAAKYKPGTTIIWDQSMVLHAHPRIIRKIPGRENLRNVYGIWVDSIDLSQASPAR